MAHPPDAGAALGFHVGCPYTAQLVCRCRRGGPPGGEAALRRHAAAAAELWGRLQASRGAGPSSSAPAAARGLLADQEAEVVLPVLRPQRESEFRDLHGWSAAEMARVLGAAETAALRKLVGPSGEEAGGAEDAPPRRFQVAELRGRLEARRAEVAKLEEAARELAAAAGAPYEPVLGRPRDASKKRAAGQEAGPDATSTPLEALLALGPDSLGVAVQAMWSDGVFYAATVTGCDAEKGAITIVYLDGGKSETISRGSGIELKLVSAHEGGPAGGQKKRKTAG